MRRTGAGPLLIDLKEVVKAGCTRVRRRLTGCSGQPVGELHSDSVSVRLHHCQGTAHERFKDHSQATDHTYLPDQRRSWLNLINRVVFPFLNVPFNEGFGGPHRDHTVESSLLQPSKPPCKTFDRTSGFGDMVYVGVVAPKESIKIESTGGVFLWGVGATTMIPTASENILGTGKYSLGPTGVLGYLGKEWTGGISPRRWWSVGGDSGRSNVNYTNLRFTYLYYSPPRVDPEAAWQFGMEPDVTIDWAAKGDELTLPVRLGGGQDGRNSSLPVSVQSEVYYSVVRRQLGSRWDARLTFIVVIPTFMF